MSVEQSVEWELAEETEVLGENLSQCHFVHHKSHMTCDLALWNLISVRNWFRAEFLQNLRL
jgi:hypothetical protein